MAPFAGARVYWIARRPNSPRRPRRWYRGTSNRVNLALPSPATFPPWQTASDLDRNEQGIRIVDGCQQPGPQLRAMLDLSAAEAIVDVKDAAEYAGLTYVSDESRHPPQAQGQRVPVREAQGPKVTDEPTLKRIKALAIPPAWTECGSARSRTATSRRPAGMPRGASNTAIMPRFREVRESTKYEHMLAFAASLPAIREQVDEHMALRGLPREKVLATVVHLLEATLIRVGNDEYASAEQELRPHDPARTATSRSTARSCGSSSRARAARTGGSACGTGGSRRSSGPARTCRDRSCSSISTRAASTRDVTSSDVNAYLREISGEDITAKDFRTWAGTVLAAMALPEFEKFDNAGERQEEHPRGHRAGRREARQHADHLPQMLHPSGDPHELHRGRLAAGGEGTGRSRAARRSRRSHSLRRRRC